MYTGLWWENLRERDHLEDPDTYGRIRLKWIFRKWGVEAWTGLIWLRIDRWLDLVNTVMNLRLASQEGLHGASK